MTENRKSCSVHCSRNGHDKKRGVPLSGALKKCGLEAGKNVVSKETCKNKIEQLRGVPAQ